MLQLSLLNEWPLAVIVTPHVLKELHQGIDLSHVKDMMFFLDMKKIDYICYVLPPGVTAGDGCSNGIKYGFGNKYASFLELPKEIFGNE